LEPALPTFAGTLKSRKRRTISMAKKNTQDVRVETREISDADDPPAGCPRCGCPDYKRETYYFRDLQELGEPGLARRVRYEVIYWKCKDCKAVFAVKYPGIPSRSPYMPGVVQYAVSRVLDRGDSTRRVVDDLNTLHHVEVTVPTVQAWVNKTGGREALPTDFDDSPPVEDFSGVLGVDGTFRGVKAKKNDPGGAGSVPLLLRVTHLPDGRLVAYWHEVSPRKKPRFSSKH